MKESNVSKSEASQHLTDSILKLRYYNPFSFFTFSICNLNSIVSVKALINIY